MDIVQLLTEAFDADLRSLIRALPRVLAALSAVLVFYFLSRGARRTALALLARGQLRPLHRKLFARLIAWMVLLLGLLSAMSIMGWSQLVQGVLTGGGFTAVVLGFAFREIGENILAGFLLSFSRPFEAGDVIRSGEHQGTVKDIDIRHTHVRTADGQDIFVPSAMIYKEPLINFTKDGLRRACFRVGIDYRNDAQSACFRFREAVCAVPGVLAEPAPTASIAALDGGYVILELSYWVDAIEQSPRALLDVHTKALDTVRQTGLREGFTFSAEVSSAVALSGAVALTSPPDSVEAAG